MCFVNELANIPCKRFRLKYGAKWLYVYDCRVHFNVVMLSLVVICGSLNDYPGLNYVSQCDIRALF